jgi:Na+-driven multidrug efflux pump
MVAHGFSVAASALVAQKLGARSFREAVSVGWITAGLGATVLGAVGLIFWFFPEQLLRIFSDNQDIISMGVPCLKLAAVIQPIMAICDAMAGGLRGAGDTRTPMMAALLGPVVVRLFFCWFLAFEMNMGLFGIWVGTSLDWVARMVLLTTAFKREKWLRIKI